MQMSISEYAESTGRFLGRAERAERAAIRTNRGLASVDTIVYASPLQIRRSRDRPSRGRSDGEDAYRDATENFAHKRLHAKS